MTNTILRITPPGMPPPNVIQFNASNVPVAQLTLSSKTLPEQQIFDYGLNFIRVKLFTIPGLVDAGAVRRQAAADQRRHRSGARCGQGLCAHRRGHRAAGVERHRAGGHRAHRRPRIQRAVELEPDRGERFNALPIGVVNGAPVTWATSRTSADAFADQTNIVHVNGKRATYLAILKHADASTLAVVDSTRDALPEIQAAAPDGLELKIDFDQSLFVRGAIQSVLREAIISSILVSLMIVVFLGSWRTMVIVCTSIPLAIFAASSA